MVFVHYPSGRSRFPALHTLLCLYLSQQCCCAYGMAFCWPFLFCRGGYSPDAGMTSACEEQAPICLKGLGCCSRFFICPKRSVRLEYFLQKGGTRMKRTIHVKSRKKTLRPAARKQQIMRKEERKQAKHRQVIYVSAAVPRCRNRGA